MKKTPGSVLHAKVPAIIAAALCGILPPRKGADELKVPRAPCFADEDVHLAVSWTGDQFDACHDLGQKVIEGFISATPIDKWGDACPKHRAIGAAISYKVNGEPCTRLITWSDAAPAAKNRAGMFFLKCGHAVASRYPLVEDRFVAWPDCRQQYPVGVTPGRYSFQAPPADHFTVAESKACEEQGFTPRTEPSEVQPANFDAKDDAKILHAASVGYRTYWVFARGLELMPEINAANKEIAKLLTEAADLRATAKAAIETIGTIHDRIDEISRWLANPVGDYPAQPIAFAS